MADKKNKKATQPITYYYNPFYNLDDELQFLEVWQVLEDDVLGSLYPWQYVATAELSNRIVTLNFLALKNFENDYKKYYDQLFVYKVSAKLLSEGNVHRLGSILQSNLILCFDIYQLEKFGDKDAMKGIKFLQNIGATIMISGVDKAPVDVLLKYQANYYLLDYRYYNEQNKGLVAMMKQLAENNSVTLVVGNVNDKSNLDIFKDNGVEIFAGSALVRPRKKIDKFVEKGQETQELVEDDTKQKYVVKEVEAPEVKERAKKEEVLDNDINLNVTSAREIFKARLAAAAQNRVDAERELETRRQEQKNQAQEDGQEQKAKSQALKQARAQEKVARNKPLDLSKKDKESKKEDKGSNKEKIKNKDIKNEASAKSQLRRSAITTSTDEFASLNKDTNNNKTITRGENVIKLNISKPQKRR